MEYKCIGGMIVFVSIKYEDIALNIVHLQGLPLR